MKHADAAAASSCDRYRRMPSLVRGFAWAWSLLLPLLCLIQPSHAHTHTLTAVTTAPFSSSYAASFHFHSHLHLPDAWLIESDISVIDHAASSRPPTPTHTQRQHVRPTITANFLWHEAEVHAVDDADRSAVSASQSSASATATASTSASASHHDHPSSQHSASHSSSTVARLHYSLLAEWHSEDESEIESESNIGTDSSESEIERTDVNSNLPSSHHEHHSSSAQSYSTPTIHHHRRHRRLLCSGASLTSCTAADLPIHTPITLQLIVNDITNTCNCPCQCECECECECKKKERKKNHPNDRTSSLRGDVSCHPSGSSSHPRSSLPSILSAPITITLQPPHRHPHDDERSLDPNAADATDGPAAHSSQHSSIPFNTVTASNSNTDSDTPIHHHHHQHRHRYRRHSSMTAQVLNDVSVDILPSKLVDRGSIMHASGIEKESGKMTVNQVNNEDDNDDAELRRALCQFFNETGGPHWPDKESHWCEDVVPVCEWMGIECAEEGRIAVLELEYSLDSRRPDGTIQPFSLQLFHHLPYLTRLDFGFNTLLAFPMPFNISMLTRLEDIYFLNLDPPAATYSPSSPRLHLIPPPSVRKLRMTGSSILVDLRLMPSLSTLIAGNLPLIIDDLSALPCLTELTLPDTSFATRAEFSHTTADRTPLDNGATTNLTSHGAMDDTSSSIIICNECILHALANLTQTNPHLLELTIGELTLAGTTRSLPTFPIINSSSLEGLALSGSWYPSDVSDDWLSGMSSLLRLKLVQTPSSSERVALHTRSFLHAASSQLSIIQLYNILLLGDMIPLTRFHALSSLTLFGCDFHSTMPPNVAHYWPGLANIALTSNSMYGPMPSFANMHSLMTISMVGNGWESVIPNDFLANSSSVMYLDLSNNDFGPSLPTLPSVPFLISLKLNRNRFNDTIPSSWSFPQLRELDLSDNHLHGALPVDWWERMPTLSQYFSVARNDMSGPIPDPIEPRVFRSRPESTVVRFSHNTFTGPLPQRLIADIFDFSSNQLSGPVILASDPLNRKEDVELIASITVADNPALTCPVMLSNITKLQHVDLQNIGADGCEWESSVHLPPSITSLDISYVQWGQAPLHFSFDPYPALESLQAVSASIGVFVTPDSESSVQSILADSNPIDYSSLTIWGVFKPLKRLSLNRCNLTGDVTTLYDRLVQILPQVDTIQLEWVSSTLDTHIL